MVGRSALKRRYITKKEKGTVPKDYIKGVEEIYRVDEEEESLQGEEV